MKGIKRMRKQYVKLTVLVLAIILLFSSFTFAEPSREKEKFVTSIIFQTLNYWHYRPVALNDQLSQKAYQKYLDTLDPNKRFFLQSDLDRLQRYQNQIDNQILRSSTELMDEANQILKERIREVIGLTDDILKHPFNYHQNDVLETDPKKRDYPKNKGELKTLWTKILKARTLDVYMELLEEKNPGKPLTQTSKIDVKLEAEARQRVSRNIRSTLTRMLQDSREKQLEVYINAILSCYDPHTSYFPPKQKEEFDISMSGTLEGIGAMLTVDGEYVRVEQIVPGSPAWRSGELKAGDLILKVGEGSKEPVDVSNMPIDDVVQLIRGKKGTEVQLTVKKPDGEIRVIRLIRDVVVLEDSYARSAVIYHQKTKKKIGYISLPSFYRDFNSKDARSSANDVRKELEKLNQDQVSGIILDLRNNSGGSLDDAVEMSGLFIKDGPVVQTRDKTGKVQVYEDPDPGIVSDVPMVVLVNSLSASASEILAAALQDYGRAVIVGSPDTFGKGTVQVLADLDQLLSDKYAKYRPAGSLKLTVQKYYRITGGSVQFKGVQSDIVLPDPYGYLEIGEEFYDTALPWDTIKPVRYTKWANSKYNIAALKQKSAERVKSSEAFQMVNSTILRVKKENEQTRRSLVLSEAIQKRNAANKQTKLYDESQHKKLPMTVTSTLPKNKQNNEWLKKLSEDIYLEEASQILNDIIEMQ